MHRRLRYHLRRWRQITRNRDVLRIVRRGLRFELTAEPDVRRRGPTFRGSDEQRRQLARIIDEWLMRGIIEPCTDDDALFSLLFPVPKKGRKQWRFVLDSRFLNQHLVQRHFRLESLPEIRALMQRGDWLASIDLSDAFLHVPINRQHRRLLAFRALGRQYRFAVMSFGTSVAPRVFTMMLKPVLAHLHQLGIRATAYLDDLLLCAATEMEALHAVATARRLLKELGFLINEEKSVTRPTRRLEHLGFVFNTHTWCIRLPRDKCAAIRKDARRVLRANGDGSLTVRRLAGLLGKVIAAMPAARALEFRRHSLARCVEYGLRRNKRNYNARVRLSRTALRDVSWLTKRSLQYSNGQPITPPTPDAVLTTDASPNGWGATLDIDGCRWSTFGHFSRRQSRLSSNWREATGVTRAFFAFRRRLRRVRTVLIRTDNTTTLSILRRFGSRHRHLGVALEPLLRFVLRHRIVLLAEHVAGAENGAADRLSRITPSRNEWHLRRSALAAAVTHFDVQPTIDWFASYNSHLCPRYVSRCPDPRAVAVDALRQPWHGEFGLFVPPINLLSRVVSRIARQHAHGIVVVPAWPSRPWWSTLMSLTTCRPLPLPRDAMVVDHLPSHPMRDERAPPLVAFLI